MKQYLDLARHILENGSKRQDRTGTGTISSFGHRLEFDMRDGFPAVTTKRLFIKGVWVELLWMLKGTPDAKFMLDNNVHIWDEWLDFNGELGRVYGVQWRNWRSVKERDFEYLVTEYIDQLQLAINKIKHMPHDRRMIVSAWNPGELDEMALPPCHLLYQFYVDGEYLDIQVYQRSADVFLGLPFDIASYATLLHMVATIVCKTPRKLIYITGDTHIYTNHVEQMWTQIHRTPHALPHLNFVYTGKDIKTIDDFELNNFELLGYLHDGPLKGSVSV